MKPYSRKIKELREKNGMTQAELARAIGVSSRSTITMYENGTRRNTFKGFLFFRVVCVLHGIMKKMCLAVD